MTFKELMQVLRREIDCLHFTPNEELRIQSTDDENTFVNLRNTNKSFPAEMTETSSSECFSMDYGLDSKSPPLKQQQVGADRPDVNSTKENFTLPDHSSD